MPVGATTGGVDAAWMAATHDKRGGRAQRC